MKFNYYEQFDLISAFDLHTTSRKIRKKWPPLIFTWVSSFMGGLVEKFCISNTEIKPEYCSLSTNLQRQQYPIKRRWTESFGKWKRTIYDDVYGCKKCRIFGNLRQKCLRLICLILPNSDRSTFVSYYRLR